MKNNELQRANAVAITVTGNDMVATFKRTHKVVKTICVVDTAFKPNEGAKPSEIREAFREYVTQNASNWDIYWDADRAKQAWARAYDKYTTDNAVIEDATTLMNMTIVNAVTKTHKDIEIVGIESYGVSPTSCKLDYVTNGKYNKDGAWASARIDMGITLKLDDNELQIPWAIEMVSGQLKKCKMTATNLLDTIETEIELNKEA